MDSVSFAVEEGGITGLIGSNGAGKTTVFNMISGVFPPTAGHIIYKNKRNYRNEAISLHVHGNCQDIPDHEASGFHVCIG